MKFTPTNKKELVSQVRPSIPIAATVEASVEPDAAGTVNVAVTLSKVSCYIKHDADEIDDGRRIVARGRYYALYPR